MRAHNETLPRSRGHLKLRLLLGCVVVMISASTAAGIELFHQHWTEYYLSDRDDDSAQQARRLGCYVCHIKGKSKKSHRNEYGQALERYLDADEFPEDWVAEHPEEAKKKIIAAFQQVEEDLKGDSTGKE